MSDAHEYAYWAGRLASTVEALLAPTPGAIDVARSTLDEYKEWRHAAEDRLS